jgi:hypothetical protein
VCGTVPQHFKSRHFFGHGITRCTVQMPTQFCHCS